MGWGDASNGCAIHDRNHIRKKDMAHNDRPIYVFTVAVLAISVLYLLQFMALDYFSVRMRPYPEEVHKYGWTLWFFPVIPVIYLHMLRRRSKETWPAWKVIAAFFLGTCIAFPMIASVGIWFHFAIGGHL